MIEFSNAREFLVKLRRLRKALKEEMRGGAQKELGQVVTKALRLMASRASRYPQQPPESAYRRTKTLGRLWTQAMPQITIGGNVIDARLQNRTPYGPYVQDPDAQAWMHRGRWQTTDDVQEETRPEVEMLLQQAGLRMVKRIAAAVG